MYKQHDRFKPPSPGAVLWRYMDFTKFVSLLDRKALFFIRADKLGDQLEGTYPKMNVVTRPARYADLPENMRDEFVFSQLPYLVQSLRKFILISCWHEGAHESAAMWKLYSREYDGIAVKTDFKSFAESLACEDQVYVGRIEYIDYDRAFIPEANFFNPYLYKRKSFEHEKEVRAIVLEPPPSQGGSRDLSNAVYQIGKYCEVNVASMIKEVVLAPYAEDWFVELVGSISELYGLKAPVRKSSLSDAPVF